MVTTATPIAGLRQKSKSQLGRGEDSREHLVKAQRGRNRALGRAGLSQGCGVAILSWPQRAQAMSAGGSGESLLWGIWVCFWVVSSAPWGGTKEGIFIQGSEWAGQADRLFKQAHASGLFSAWRQLTAWSLDLGAAPALGPGRGLSGKGRAQWDARSLAAPISPVLSGF